MDFRLPIVLRIRQPENWGTRIGITMKCRRLADIWVYNLRCLFDARFGRRVVVMPFDFQAAYCISIRQPENRVSEINKAIGAECVVSPRTMMPPQ